MSKSFVTMLFSVCPICLQEQDDGIAITKNLKERFERKTFNTWRYCDVCNRQLKTHIALIETTANEPTLNMANGIKHRTGRYAFLDRKVAKQTFNIPIDDIAFIDVETFTILVEKING